MATNFEKKSLFAEHLTSSGGSSHDRQGSSRDSANTLDDLFGSKPATASNRANKPGRITVKPW